MANPLNSWRERRWKVFERAFIAKPNLEKELRESLNIKNKKRRETELGFTLINSSIPLQCTPAIIEWLKDNTKSRDYYLSKIQTPIDVWIVPPVEYEYIIENGAIVDRDTTLKWDENEIIRQMNLLRGKINITLDPQMTKSEVHELINEQWDMLSALLNTPNEDNYFLFVQNLSSKIFPTRHEKDRKKDYLMLKLYYEGYSYEKIAWALKENGYLVMNNGAIRTRITRLRKRLKMLQRSKLNDVTTYKFK